MHGAALTAWLPRQLSPATVDIYMAAPAFQSTAREREPVYGTAYTLTAVDAATRERWATMPIDAALHIVRPNIFIPRNFSLQPPPRPHTPAANLSV